MALTVEITSSIVALGTKLNTLKINLYTSGQLL